MAQKLLSEKNKKIALAALFVVMISVVIYQLFFSSPPPKPRLQSSNGTPSAAQSGSSAPITTTRQAQSVSERQALFEQQLADTSPLNLGMLAGGAEAARVGSRGNVFAYYVPPPQPPPKPPPPPPITLQYIQPQTVVAGTPRKFTMTVTGKDFPPDAQIFLAGTPRPTKRVNDTTLTTDFAPEEYSSARNVNVEVKSQSDPAKLYSTAIPFIVQPSPEPPFKYIGRIGELGLFEITGTKEIVRQGRGATIQGVWRIDSISDAAVEITDTRYDIKKRIPMQDAK